MQNKFHNHVMKPRAFSKGRTRSELSQNGPFATLMATKEMHKFGYQLSQGLGATGHGKAALIELLDNK